MSTMSKIDDIWEFVSTDDELDATVSTCAEEAALHVGVPAEWTRRFDDPARRDVATSDEDDWPALIVADDEDDGSLTLEADDEEDLDMEELLERQHYAAAPSSDAD
jgi:hypothetical protein